MCCSVVLSVDRVYCSLGFVCTSHACSLGFMCCFVVLSVDRVYCSLGFVCTSCVLWCFDVFSGDSVYLCSLGFVCTYCVLMYLLCSLGFVCNWSVLWGLCIPVVFSGVCV